MKFIWALVLLIPTAYGVSLKDYDHYRYEVFFTNPECPAYEINKTVYSFSGNLVTNKPKNVYCKYRDARENQTRENAPHYNLRKLITNKDIKELRMAYLSFSNSDIINAVCEAIEKNNIAFSLMLDKENKSKSDKMEKIKKLKACKPAKKYIEAGVANYPEIKFKGHNGGIGFAHNKIIYASYKSDPTKVTVVFSSANMSSGTTLHHENWHFVTTSKDSYFAKAHVCILDGMKDHSDSVRANRNLGRKKMSAIKNFKTYVAKCRKAIKAPEESDIKVKVVPGDGEEYIQSLAKKISSSKKISMAVHRFSNKILAAALQKAGKNPKQDVRFIADDDIFWAGQVNEMNGRIVCNRRNPRFVNRVGANMCNEFYKVRDLKRKGVDIKYMETNQKLFLLHHNKYIIFEDLDGVKGKDALHTGAGNFTIAAFTKNFENYYYITIPEVLEKFKTQYDHVWNSLATEQKDLPTVQVLP